MGLRAGAHANVTVESGAPIIAGGNPILATLYESSVCVPQPPRGGGCAMIEKESQSFWRGAQICINVS